ncbi:MAG: FprA family A-type flavoprotein, partial [Candidatus Margulisiibacteriota bacterium]
KMVDYLMDALSGRGVSVRPFNLVKTDIGELAMALVDAATVVIGAPAALVGPHPLVVYATYLINALRPKTRFVSIIGSYGWGSKAVETITGMLTNLKIEMIPPVIAKGDPKEADFKALDVLAVQIAENHKKIGIA